MTRFVLELVDALNLADHNMWSGIASAEYPKAVSCAAGI